jgi:general stress protein YciG
MCCTPGIPTYERGQNAGEGTVAKEDRGFASMDRGRQREIASKGGRAAHQKGTAHEWTTEEAREAGRKGGMASRRRKQQEGEGERAEATSEDRGGGDTGDEAAGSGRLTL